MKYLLLCLLLTGCADSVAGWRVDQIQKMCEKHGGIREISTFIKTVGECNDGAFVWPERVSK